MPLTALAVRNAKPASKPVKMSDGGGLYLLVNPNGSRLWRMNYRWLGRQKTLSIGAYPDLELADARQERKKARKQLAQGVDPSQAKIEARIAAKIAAGNTFRTVAEEWVEQRAKEAITDTTRAKDRAVLNVHAYPAFGDMPIDQIKPLTVLGVIRKIEARGHREASHRFKSVVGRVFGYALITERVERNPAADLTGLLLPREVEHHAGITDPVKVGRLMLAIGGYDGTAAVRLGLRFLAHTFLRTIEMRSAEWAWIDWDGEMMRVPAGFMKRRREHIVPLSRQTLAILQEMKSLALPGPLIFPGVKGGRNRMSENTINGALRRLGYEGDVHTGHGFRTTASTTLNESGRFHTDWIERQLSHVEENKVRGAYNAALYLPERAKMMQWYSDWLDTQADVARLM